MRVSLANKLQCSDTLINVCNRHSLTQPVDLCPVSILRHSDRCLQQHRWPDASEEGNEVSIHRHLDRCLQLDIGDDLYLLVLVSIPRHPHRCLQPTICSYYAFVNSHARCLSTALIPHTTANLASLPPTGADRWLAKRSSLSYQPRPCPD